MFLAKRIKFGLLRRISTSEIIPLFCFVCTFVFYLKTLARFDVDPYHDGFVYVPALASNEGLLPGRDYLAFYGPLLPIVQGFSLAIFGSRLYSLRVLAVCLIFLIAITCYRLLREKLSKFVSMLLVLVWLLGPSFISQPTLSWPDLFLALIQLVSLSILWKFNSENLSHGVFLMGMLSGIGVLFKTNYALDSTLVLIIILTMTSTNTRKLYVKNFMFGLLVSFGTAILSLTFFGLIQQYFQQTILYSFQSHQQGKSLRGLFNLKIPLYGILLSGIFYFGIRLKKSVYKEQSKKPAIFIGVFLLLLSSIAALKFRVLNQPFLAADGNFTDNIKLFLKWLIYAPIFTSIFLLIYSALSTIKLRYKAKPVSSKEFISLFAAVELVRLYPSSDIGHLWYMVPVALVGIVFDKKLGKKILLHADMVVSICIAFLAGLILVLQSYVAQGRVPYKSESLDGMLGLESKVQIIDDGMRAVEKFAIPGDIDFQCPLALYASAGNRYLPVDWHYATLPEDSFPRPRTEQIFYCGETNNPEFQKLLKDYKVVYEGSGDFPNTKNILMQRRS